VNQADTSPDLRQELSKAGGRREYERRYRKSTQYNLKHYNNINSIQSGVFHMNPILLDFENQFFTNRLLIRMPMPRDGEVVYEAIMESIDELKLWLPFAQKE
jgi:hypothetical protein